MNLKVLISFALILFAVSSKALNPSDKYKLDEASIDCLMAESEEIAPTDELLLTGAMETGKKNQGFNSKQQTAAILATIMIFTGIGELIPFHRFVLGANGAEVKIFFAYFCTASGCGVGLVLDAIFLLMNIDDNNYENNDQIIMWRE